MEKLSGTKKWARLLKPGKYIQIPGIGLWKKEIFDEAVKVGAIIKRDHIYAIPTETKLIGKDPTTGKKYPSPLKVVVVSQKWYEFKRKHKL